MAGQPLSDHPHLGLHRDRRLAGLEGRVARQTFNPRLNKACSHRHAVRRPTLTFCAALCADPRSAKASTMRARSDVLERPVAGLWEYLFSRFTRIWSNSYLSEFDKIASQSI